MTHPTRGRRHGYQMLLPRLITLALLLCVAAASRAATLTVTDASDTGPGTLRDTVAAAQPGDTIQFAPGVTSITLTTGQILIGVPLTINGPGVTIDGNNNSRIFEVTGGTAERPVTLTGLTLQHGKSQGAGGAVAIDAGATAMVSNCAILNSRATNYRYLETVPFQHFVYANGNGGGLANVGTLTLTGCALSKNYAESAGGSLFNAGSLTVTRTLFTANQANEGGAFYNGSYSDPITFQSYSGVAAITASLFAGNSTYNANGGAIENNTHLDLIGCTVTGNRASYACGGLSNGGSATVLDCIFWGDSGGYHNEILNSYGYIIVSYSDVMDGLSQQDFGSVTDGGNNLYTDPLFKTPFTDNATPFDLHPQSASPCVGAGFADVGNAADFAGMLRLDPPTMGAFERANQAPFANAGMNQTVAYTGPLTSVTLDGSHSSDPEGDNLTYAWTENGRQIATGAGPTVGLALGTHTLTLIVTDAYNASSLPATVQILVKDATPPVTTALLDPSAPNGQNGWYTKPVKVTLSAQDNVAVAATYYTLDGGSQQAYTGPVTVSGDRQHSFTYWSVDTSNNTEPSHSLTLKIDGTAPKITGPGDMLAAQDTAYGATVTFTVGATDATSNIASTSSSPASGSVFPLGLTTVTTKATDKAGNSTTGSFKVLVLPPASTVNIAVSGSGTVGSKRGPQFALDVQTDRLGLPYGEVDYADTAANVEIELSLVTAVTVNGTHARIFGLALLNDWEIVSFEVDVDNPGGAKDHTRDAFAIQMSNGYSHAGKLAIGKIQIR